MRLRHGPMGSAVHRLPTRRAGEHAGDRHRLRLRRPRRERRELQLGRPALPERVAERAPQHLVHERLLEKPHLRLRRVHVDVHAIGRNPDEQVHLGAALLDGRDAVGLRNRVRDGAVLDDAAVDEDVLGAADRPLVAERRDVAVDLQPARLLAQLDQIEPLAEQLEEALAEPVRPAGTASRLAGAARS